MRLKAPFGPILLLAITAAGGLNASCTMIQNAMPSHKAAVRSAAQVQELQLKVMRFADEYAGGIVTPIQQFQATTDDPSARLAAQNWKLSQATAAYTIASAPDAVGNALDMIVLATLSRMVIEDTWVAHDYGARAEPLREAHRRLEERARDLAKDILTADQLAQLLVYAEDWRKRYPQVRNVASVHFRDFETATGAADSSDGRTKNLFSLVGLDPFSNLDPAVREITQTRQLAERSIFYAQRMPSLLQMQIEQLSYQMAITPEVRRSLDNADRVTDAVAAAGRVADELPVILAREREAAIKQFTDSLTIETAHTRELVIELRGAIEAGKATSDSVTDTIRSLDQLMERFDKPKPAGTPPAPPARPFDITEYTQGARELASTVRELQTLVVQLDSSGSAVNQLTSNAAGELNAVVDHAFWRVVEAIIVLMLAVVIAVGLLRLLSRRLALTDPRRGAE